jgi:hypothetical protein
MAWHGSQLSEAGAWLMALRVGICIVSHGCIRVACDSVKRTNQNSWSGKTKLGL